MGDTTGNGGAVHLGPDEAAWTSPEDELFDSEMGYRVGWEAIMADLASAGQSDDGRGLVTVMVRQVAEATSWRGLPFPPEWWPVDAGPVPHPASSGVGHG